MLADMDNYVKISGGATSDAGFSASQRTNSRAIIDSGRYLHSNPGSLFLPAISSAFSTRPLNHLSGSSASRTGLGDLEKTARRNDLSAALASGTVHGSGTRF